MAIENRTDLKSYFQEGDIPTQDNFGSLLDSYVHKTDDGLNLAVDETTGELTMTNDLVIDGDLLVKGKMTINETDLSKGDVQLGDEASDTITVAGHMVGPDNGPLDIRADVNLNHFDLNNVGNIRANIAHFQTLNLSNAFTTSGNLTASGSVFLGGPTKNTNVLGELIVKGQNINQTIANLTNDKVSKSGDTMNGDLNINGDLDVNGDVSLGTAGKTVQLNAPLTSTHSLTAGNLTANGNVSLPGVANQATADALMRINNNGAVSKQIFNNSGTGFLKENGQWENIDYSSLGATPWVDIAGTLTHNGRVQINGNFAVPGLPVSPASPNLVRADDSGNFVIHPMNSSAAHFLKANGVFEAVQYDALAGTPWTQIGGELIHAGPVRIDGGLDLQNITTSDIEASGTIRAANFEHLDGTPVGGGGPAPETFWRKSGSSTALTDIFYVGGNVGIGTENPQCDLDVRGMICVTDGIKFGDGTIMRTAPVADPRIDTGTGTTTGTTTGTGTGTIDSGTLSTGTLDTGALDPGSLTTGGTSTGIIDPGSLVTDPSPIDTTGGTILGDPRFSPTLDPTVFGGTTLDPTIFEEPATTLETTNIVTNDEPIRFFTTTEPLTTTTIEPTPTLTLENTGFVGIATTEPTHTLTVGGSLFSASSSIPGVDYAEYFESANGKAIPAGTPVVLEKGLIRPAKKGESPFGIISANPGVIGGMFGEWPKKYIRDDFGAIKMEKYKEEIMVPKMKKGKKGDAKKEVLALDKSGKPILVGTGKFTTGERKKLNPKYDPKKTYVPRDQRPEWNCVGILGQLPMRAGKPTASSWIKIKDISAKVELWLVK